MVVSRTKVWLDARFAKVRRKETNGSNFLAELMARATGADVALLNAGSIWADRFPMREVIELLMPNVKNIPCSDVFLQLHVCSHTHTVDGMRFAFSPSKLAGSRVVPGSVFMRDPPFVRKRHTILCGQNVDTAKNGIERMTIKD